MYAEQILLRCNFPVLFLMEKWKLTLSYFLFSEFVRVGSDEENWDQSKGRTGDQSEDLSSLSSRVNVS